MDNLGVIFDDIMSLQLDTPTPTQPPLKNTRTQTYMCIISDTHACSFFLRGVCTKYPY